MNRDCKMKPSKSHNGPIPFPHLESYMHKRIEIPKKKWNNMLSRHNQQPRAVRVLESILTRLANASSFLGNGFRKALMRLGIKIISFFYRIYYRMEVQGKKNIPKNGAIFLINHPRRVDVVMSFMGAFGEPLGAFTDIGSGISADILELIGFVPRLGKANVMIEKMVRQLLLRSHYFAIWPEGTPDKGNGIMHGFSGIVKVYATVNCKKNRIPFVPVVMQLSPWPKKRNKLSRYIPPKIRFIFLKPYFIPQNWLRSPKKGGKTKREIIDLAMKKIARKLGQEELGPNPVLNRRKERYNKPWH